MMKLVGSLIFAVGIMITIAGGARTPYVAVLPNDFVKGLAGSGNTRIEFEESGDDGAVLEGQWSGEVPVQFTFPEKDVEGPVAISVHGMPVTYADYKIAASKIVLPQHDSIAIDKVKRFPDGTPDSPQSIQQPVKIKVTPDSKFVISIQDTEIASLMIQAATREEISVQLPTNPNSEDNDPTSLTLKIYNDQQGRFVLDSDLDDAAKKYTREKIQSVAVTSETIRFEDKPNQGDPMPYVVRLGTNEDGGDNNDLTDKITRLLDERGVEYSQYDATATLPNNLQTLPAFPSTWPIFLGGALLSLIGIIVWRMGIKPTTDDGDVDTPSKEHRDPVFLLNQMIEPVRSLETACRTMTSQQITEAINDINEQYVLPFSDSRMQLMERFGTGAGAEILVTLSFGERMLNRAWSAAADEHLEEARDCIPQSLAGIEEANKLVKNVLDATKKSGE